MQMINSLTELFNSNVIVPLETQYHKNYCVLEEPDSDYKLTIKHLPKDCIVVKCDKFVPTLTFFSNSKMECKRADYAIILTEKKMILYIELKRSKRSSEPKEIIAQLKGAKCIMDYCSSILDSFWNINELNKYQNRYYKYIDIPPRKTPSRKGAYTENITPESARKISKNTIFFRELIS